MPGLTCAIHQPNFFPRLSTLAKLYAADVWVILDDVQFSRRDYQHRCYLPPAGTALPARWLTVPVHLPDGRATLIKDALIADPDLAARHVQGLLRQGPRLIVRVGDRPGSPLSCPATASACRYCPALVSALAACARLKPARPGR
jgi:WbqC-like protein family